MNNHNQYGCYQIWYYSPTLTDLQMKQFYADNVTDAISKFQRSNTDYTYIKTAEYSPR